MAGPPACPARTVIDWSTLPVEQLQRLIVLLSLLVENQLSVAAAGEENADEYRPLADSPPGGHPEHLKDSVVAQATPSRRVH